MAPELPPCGTLELDGLWTRTSRVRAELKVIRDAAGTALGAFGSWAEAIDRAWQLRAHHPAHPVSDGDGAIAAGIDLVYGGEARRQLCAFHLLREYRQNIGVAGFAAARRLLNAGSLSEGREWARRIMRATAGAARCWCEKALYEGLRHLTTEQVAQRRRRDWSGAIGSCGGGRSWGRYGRSTTCWRCCQSRAAQPNRLKRNVHQCCRQGLTSPPPPMVR